MIQRLDFAPLDGITRSVFRRVWFRHFGGADRIFVPFFSPTHHHIVTPRDLREITREGAKDLPLVPQVMSRLAPDFLWAAEVLEDLGYREINLRAMKLIRDGGFLATCSCSHFVDYELFTQTIGQAARNVHKRLRQVEYRTQAPDHPILWDAEDSYYLKFYIFQVCDEK